MQKTVKVDLRAGQAPSDLAMQLDNDIKKWYLEENLNLIGGFQDDKS